MENQNFLSFLIQNNHNKNIFSHMKAKDLVLIIDRNTPFSRLKVVDYNLYNDGYFICGEDDEGHYIYVNYEKTQDKYKKLIEKANKRYLKQLGLYNEGDLI